MVARHKVVLIALAVILEAVIGVGAVWIIRPRGEAPRLTTMALGHAPVGVSVSAASVTSADRHHNSAVSLRIDNNTPGPIVVTSVSSSLAASAMLHIDPNLRDAAAVMSVQSSMEIPARRALAWGWRGAGAMLMDLSRPLRIGERIRLRLSWLDATGHRENLSVSAVVTASPSNLQYVAPMAM